MSVYEINGVYIVAENPDSAFAEYLDETDGLEHIYIGDLNESEEEEIIIRIRRLSQKEIEREDIECCEDGCILCEDKGDHVYVSLKDLMEKENKLPYVIAKEE